MIVADLAWILASNGRSVLAVDWNLEAPGLGEYLHPFLPADYENRPGVIDALWDALLEAMNASRREPPNPPGLQAHALRLSWEFPRGGRLDFVSAGRAATHATRVPLFPWEAFVRRHGGADFIETLGVQLRQAYDYILIDGRTGLADSLGVCTVRLPDILVCPFSMVGSNPWQLNALLSTIFKQRAGVPLRVFPVPTGVQQSELAALERLRDNTREVFAALPGVDREYWSDVEVPYLVFYAYRKIPSVFGDQPHFRGVRSVMERLTALVSDGVVVRFPELADSDRNEALDAYQRPRQPGPSAPSGPPTPFDGTDDFFFVSYKREEFHRIVLTLAQATEMGHRVWWDEGIPGGDEWEHRLDERIKACRGVLVFLSEQAVTSEHVRSEVQAAHRLRKPIVPVRLDSSLQPPMIEGAVGKIQFVDDPRGQPSQALEGALRFALGRR
jgi:hypothetical protein